MPMPVSRRGSLRLLAAAAAAALAPVGCTPRRTKAPAPPGAFVDADLLAGHRMRQEHEWGTFPVPTQQYDAIVVGGGVAGLSACWKLRRAGLERILLLELGDTLGGTSRRAGQQPTFPWGAHYINIPPAEADCIHEVLGDLGVIEGYDAAGRPQVAPQHLLRWPHERLRVDGAWYEGLDPFAAEIGQPESLARFEDDMLKWALYRGRDGRRGFSMPLLYSSSDEKIRDLDRITMAEYMRSRGFDDEGLDWLVRYACLDDYGSLPSQVSAWAGIHYFSCRYYDYRLASQYPSSTLTWPEGNGFLVDRLQAGLEADQVRSGSLCLRLEPTSDGVRVWGEETKTGQKLSWTCKSLVYAAKLHTAPFTCPALPDAHKIAIDDLVYAPWLVAALHVGDWEDGGYWDNVFFDSPSLGYIRADHQRPRAKDKVLLYYLPLPQQDGRQRRLLLEGSADYWSGRVVEDVLRHHPELEGRIERIEMHRWGHAMPRPKPGALWGPQAASRRRSWEGVFFAGCDTTALPLFEEACFSGIRAAESALTHLGVAHATSLPGLPDEYRN